MSPFFNALLGAFVPPLVLPPRPGVTKANFDRIHKGMNKNEVHAILGMPGSVSDSLRDIGWYAEAWSSDDGARACILFAGEGALDTIWSPSTENFVNELRWSPLTENIFDKLRRWLRLSTAPAVPVLQKGIG